MNNRAYRNNGLQQKIEELGGARLLTFNPEQDYSGSRDDPLVKALHQFSESPAAPFGALLNEELLLRAYTSRAISARQLEIFNRIIRKQHLQPTALSLGTYWPEIARTKETPTK